MLHGVRQKRRLVLDITIEPRGLVSVEVLETPSVVLLALDTVTPAKALTAIVVECNRRIKR